MCELGSLIMNTLTRIWKQSANWRCKVVFWDVGTNVIFNVIL